MEFDAEVPLDGEDTKEDTAPTDEDPTLEEGTQDEEAPSEVNTVAYQSLINQIDDERA